MKIKKIAVTVIFLLLVLNSGVNAQSMQNELFEALPEIDNFEGYERLEKYGLILEDENWIQNLTPKNLFEILKELILNGYKQPLTAFLMVTAAVIITAAFSSFLKDNQHFLNFLTIAVTAAVLLPLFATLKGAANTLSGVANFMLSFVPIFIGVVISSGFVATASTTSPLLLFVATAVSKISTSTFLPLMGGYLSLTISSSVSPIFSLNSFANSIKTAANYIMGIFTTLFLGVLSISGTVTSSSDSLALKTTRFLVSGVPVVGGAIAESLTAATASIEVFKSGVGAFGILAVAVIILPMLITLLLWKVALFLSSFISEILDIKTLSSFLNAVGAVVSVTIGVLIFVGLLFIIGLTILIRLRK